MKDHIIDEHLNISEKLRILSAAAKYDVACTSSGVDRKGNGSGLGNAAACGICHTFAGDGRCISLLKILMTNECIYDCKYCVNRSSNDVVRTSFTPDEICRLTYQFYRRNYIEGLFLSSGIVTSPDHTMTLICETLYRLRKEYAFNGYVHVKAIPGASAELIDMAGWLADRMSVNLELPTAEGLRMLAPHKNRKSILNPMRQIQKGILTRNCTLYGHDEKYISESGSGKDGDFSAADRRYDIVGRSADIAGAKKQGRYFTPAGQSTQMIVGATNETDYEIITIAENLYNNFNLKRVFYSGYVPINEDKYLPAIGTEVPLLREHRLYQADWLLRYYGFKAEELLTASRPQFNTLIDPKCDWAVRHLELFPVEINKADYYTLLRVPGIGMRSAKRIVAARRYGKLDFNDIKKMGVVLRRALYFVTCGGRMMYDIRLDEHYITRQLAYKDDDVIKIMSKTDRERYVQTVLPL